MFNSVLNNRSGKQMQKSNPLSPERMTPSQRIAEVANIIAQGIIRLHNPNPNPNPNDTQFSDSDSDISLAIPAYRSVHSETENVNTMEEK